VAPPGAEGVFLNQNLAVYPTFILRDFHAYFLSTLLHRLFDLIDEPRYRLRLVKCYNDMLDGVGARTNPARRSRTRAPVQHMFGRVSRML
jgi:hypothetical protein